MLLPVFIEANNIPHHPDEKNESPRLGISPRKKCGLLLVLISAFKCNEIQNHTQSQFPMSLLKVNTNSNQLC
jgi:hypothetical protein